MEEMEVFLRGGRAVRRAVARPTAARTDWLAVGLAAPPVAPVRPQICDAWRHALLVCVSRSRLDRALFDLVLRRRPSPAARSRRRRAARRALRFSSPRYPLPTQAACRPARAEGRPAQPGGPRFRLPRSCFPRWQQTPPAKPGRSRERRDFPRLRFPGLPCPPLRFRPAKTAPGSAWRSARCLPVPLHPHALSPEPAHRRATWPGRVVWPRPAGRTSLREPFAMQGCLRIPRVPLAATPPRQAQKPGATATTRSQRTENESRGALTKGSASAGNLAEAICEGLFAKAHDPTGTR